MAKTHLTTARSQRARHNLTIRIDRFSKSDPNRAHVLLHSLANIYDHTPRVVREVQLRAWRDRYPELVKACLADHAQEGSK